MTNSENKNSADIARGNLKKFTSNSAKEAQKKSVIKRKENKAYREVAQEALIKLLNAGAMDALTDVERFKSLPTKDKLAILEHLRDSSGEKPTNKQEITGDIKTTNPVINILPVKAQGEY